MESGSIGGRSRRVLGAGLTVIGASFLVLFVPIIVYAFVLAFQVRGIPDQSAINHFAATISPAWMPWLERLLTLLLAFRVVRRNDAAGAIDGLLVGAVAGLLSLAVILTFGGKLGVGSVLPVLVLVGLGWLGGLVGQRMSRTSSTRPEASGPV
jgi:hypothetical protein